MNEIYWLTRLSILNDVCMVTLALCGCALCVLIVVSPIIIDLYRNMEEESKIIVKKAFKGLIIVLVFSGLGAIFIPSKKDLLLIYGLGSTIDYVKSNDKAKELPDKVVDALTRYVDTIAKEEQEQE